MLIDRIVDMQLLIDERISLVQNSKDRKVLLDTPKELAELVIARMRRGDIGAKRIVAEVNCPVVTLDGRLLGKGGFDEASGVYVHLPRDYKCGVPDAPTDEDVRAALLMMMRPFRAYNWIGPESRAAILSAVITAVERGVLDMAPATGVFAFVQGSGKTKAAEALNILCTGREAELTLPPRDEAEWSKQIVTWLAEGRKAVVVDNMTGYMVGQSFANLITGKKTTGRILGASKDATANLRALITLTANNPAISADWARRIIRCDIDGGENPTHKGFDFDPVEEAMFNRIAIAEAVCTLLVAFFQAGAPKMVKDTSGGFNAWTRLCRDSILWAASQGLTDVLGQPIGDPATSIMSNPLAADVELSSLDDLLTSLFALSGGEMFDARQVRAWFDLGSTHPTEPAGMLREALIDFGAKPDSTVKSIGRFLAKRVGRWSDGLVLRQFGGEKAKRQEWKVCRREEV